MNERIIIGLGVLALYELAIYAIRRKKKMNDNTCVCCGEQIPEGRQICPKCEKDDDAGMELVFDEESGTWGKAPEVYGVINCPTKEDYEYVLNAIKAHKQLEDKHWNECRQIAHYEDELRKVKELLTAAVDDVRYCMRSYDPCEVCALLEENGECVAADDGDCSEKYKWRYEAEALALIGEDTNLPAREDDENKQCKEGV